MRLPSAAGTTPCEPKTWRFGEGAGITTPAVLPLPDPRLFLPNSCGAITDAGPGSLSTICCAGQSGRYVSILIPGREDALVLCEVEVVLQGCLPLPGGEGLPLGLRAAGRATAGAGSLMPHSLRQFQPSTWRGVAPSPSHPH